MQSSLSTDTHLTLHLGKVAYTTFTPGCPRLAWCVCVCACALNEVKGTKLHEDRNTLAKLSWRGSCSHFVPSSFRGGCFERMQNVFWPFLTQTGTFFSPPHLYTVAFPITQGTLLHVNGLVSICLREHSSSSAMLLSICFAAPRFPTCGNTARTLFNDFFFTPPGETFWFQLG